MLHQPTNDNIMKTKLVIDHIVKWLDDYTNKANIKGFVIGAVTPQSPAMKAGL